MFGRKENNVIVIKAKNGLELEGWNEESSNKGDDRNNQGQCADDA